MAEAEQPSILALRYMLDFRCIGGDCEDTCCGSGWVIPVDQEHLIKLRRALPRNESDAQATTNLSALPVFDQAVVLLPKKERSERAYAKLKLADDGTCPLLTEQKLCRLHAALGEDLLPDTCATYPRHISQVGSRLELAGSLSCPEVARRALLPAAATDLVTAPSSLLARGQLQISAPAAPTAGADRSDRDAAYRHLDVVRGAMVRLLSRTDFSLKCRFFFTAFLAHKCADLPAGPDGVLDAEAFLQQAAMMDHPDALSALAERLHDSLPHAPLPLPLLLSLLRLQRQVPGGGAFARLVVETAHSFAQSPAASPQPGHHEIENVTASDDDRRLADEPARIDIAYRKRQQAIDRAFLPRIERYLFNYARHFWMKDWYTQSPSLAAHVQGFLARVALLRFVLLAHPQALAATQAASPAEGEALLDKLAVRVFYSLSRTLEHSGGFRNEFEKEVKQKAPGIAAAIALLSV